MKPPTMLELTVDQCQAALRDFRPHWTASVLHDEPRVHQVAAHHTSIITTFIAEVRETFYGPAFCVRVIHHDQEKARFSLLCGAEPPIESVVRQAESFVETHNL